MVETCSVVERGCYSPANMEPPERARAVCFACGLAVCSNPDCSRRLKYLDYGVRRLCLYCAEQHGLWD